MRPRDLAELLLLGALWGASFLFMRLGAADFGAVALVFVRVAGAAAVLLPLLAWRGHGAALVAHWRPIALVGLVNSALPFLLFMVAAYVLSAGLMSIFNATAPIWAALVGWAWLGERPARMRAVGLAIGLAGAAALAWREGGWRGDAVAAPTGASVTPALGIVACLAAPVLYGVAANLSRRHLAGVPPLAVAAGSQLAASLMLALPAWLAWPTAPLSGAAWASAAALAFACTGLAYLLYFTPQPASIAGVGCSASASQPHSIAKAGIR